MFNFNSLINSRFSARSYTRQKVDKEVILEILEAARMAPSAVNFQPWKFVVLTNVDRLNDFQEVYPRTWFKEAPVCIVVCADHSKSWKRKSDGKDFADIDIAITVDHLILKATEMGLGTCWVCNFDPDLARKKLELQEHIEPLVLVPMGYTDAKAPLKVRKSLDDIVHWEKFTDR